MTTKEALTELFNEANRGSNAPYKYTTHDLWEMAKQIQRDLEVLEILKPKLMVEKGSTWEYLEIKHPFFDTQDEIDKVKEWLGNE